MEYRNWQTQPLYLKGALGGSTGPFRVHFREHLPSTNNFIFSVPHAAPAILVTLAEHLPLHLLQLLIRDRPYVGSRQGGVRDHLSPSLSSINTIATVTEQLPPRRTRHPTKPTRGR